MDELQTALAELEDANPDIRERALDKIGTLKPVGAFELIAVALADPDAEVRGTAACNLGEIEDSRSISVLIDLAKTDSVEAVRAEALDALGNYRSPEILNCLLDEIDRKKKSRRPRQVVAKQLQYYDESRSYEALINLLLNDDDIYVRIAAADSLLLIQNSHLLSFSRSRIVIISRATTLMILVKKHTWLLKRTWLQAMDDESTYVANVAREAYAKLQTAIESALRSLFLLILAITMLILAIIMDDFRGELVLACAALITPIMVGRNSEAGLKEKP